MEQDCEFYIIVAVLNAHKTLEKCLKSVLDQEYPTKQVFVVDGGSIDGSVEIIQRYQDQLGWWVTEPDRGIYDAWNKALCRIEKGWVLFLGADDTLLSPSVLTLAAEALQLADPAIRVAYGQVALVADNGQTLALKGDSWAVAGKNFTSTMTLPHQGIFHHSTLFQEFGNFNPEFIIAGDYDLLLRVLPENPPLFLNDLVVASWRIGGISYDVRTPLLVAREFSKARRLNGFDSFSAPLAVFYLKAYVLKGLSLLFGYRFTSWFAGIYRNFTRQWIKDRME